MKKPYRLYELTDFLTDTRFKNWVLYNDPADGQLWTDLGNQYPEKKEIMDEAAEQIRTFRRAQSATAGSARLETDWERISQTLFADTENSASADHDPAVPVRRIRHNIKKYIAAAVLIISCAAGILYFYNKPDELTYQTTYGEQKRIVLPDQSVVHLGPNSELRVRQQSGRQREAWLEGSAHFEVYHFHQAPEPVAPGHRFLVHTAEQSTVEVLGTVFSIQRTGRQTHVSLKSGSVKLLHPSGEQVMLPSETAYLSADAFTVTPVPADITYHWDRRELSMNNASLQSVIAYIGEFFGIQVTIRGDPSAFPSLDGIIPFEDRRTAVHAVALLTGSAISYTDGQFIISMP